MSLSKFLRELQENGRVHVAVSPDRSNAALKEFEAELIALDALARQDLAYDPPPFLLAPAAWAAMTLYQGCQFLIYRDVNADVVAKALARPCPEPPNPSVCYSVDLTFRYLPDLIALARGIAEGDPLVDGLMTLAAAWPLSSVGVKNLNAGAVTAFISNQSLRRLYADRIMERRDASRLDNVRTLDAVRVGLGAFPELCPELAGSVQPVIF